MSKLPQRTNYSKYWNLNSEIVFLNHGSYGACPTEVLNYQSDLRIEIEKDPVHFFDTTSKELWAKSIEVLANFINADKEGMTFVSNATSHLVKLHI